MDTFWGGVYSIFQVDISVNIPRTYQPYVPQLRLTSSIASIYCDSLSLHHGGVRQGRALPAGTLQRWAIAPSTATLTLIHVVASRSGSGRRQYAPETRDENHHRISSSICYYYYYLLWRVIIITNMNMQWIIIIT